MQPRGIGRRLQSRGIPGRTGERTDQKKGASRRGDVLNEERNVSVLRVKFWHVSELRKQK